MSTWKAILIAVLILTGIGLALVIFTDLVVGVNPL